MLSRPLPGRQQIKKQRPPDVCAQEMGIEETAAVYFWESISCCAFPRWTVWFTSILAQSARTVPRGWAGLDDCNPDQIIRLLIEIPLLGLVLKVAKNGNSSSRLAAICANCGNCKFTVARPVTPIILDSKLEGRFSMFDLFSISVFELDSNFEFRVSNLPAADPQPSPLALAMGVGRGRAAMTFTRSRFSKCGCSVLGLVVSFIAVQLLVRLVFDSSIRAIQSIAPRARSKKKTRKFGSWHNL
jgi:hypothetical protein